ncbi:MAG: VWD domain-containing protein [Vampirovibrionales bacterium]|nr:VWD domain-containing protein [Vampirovibrionales bacterium]
MSLNTNFFSPLNGNYGTSYHYTTNNIKDLNVYQQNNQLNQLNQLAYMPPQVPQPQVTLPLFTQNPWPVGQNNFGLRGFNTPLIGNVNGSVNFFNAAPSFAQSPMPQQWQFPPVMMPYPQPLQQCYSPWQPQPPFQIPQWQNWNQLPPIAGAFEHDLPPIPAPYKGGKEGKVWGDPHFVGFDGEQFDVQGEEGKTYNIITDKNYLFNARFDRYTNPGTTIMGEVYVQVGDQKLTFDKNGKATLNGKDLTKGQKVQFNDKEYAEFNEKGELVIHSKEYESKFITNHPGTDHAHIDYHVKLTEEGPFSDGVKAHGLLGQTADGKGEVKNGKQGSGAQGEGAIEGVYTDYEVKEGGFGSSFKFQAKKLTASDIRALQAPKNAEAKAQ